MSTGQTEARALIKDEKIGMPPTVTELKMASLCTFVQVYFFCLRKSESKCHGARSTNLHAHPSLSSSFLPAAAAVKIKRNVKTEHTKLKSLRASKTSPE
jgi:ribosome-binding factor A